jgi:hypothetical protein
MCRPGLEITGRVHFEPKVVCADGVEKAKVVAKCLVGIE